MKVKVTNPDLAAGLIDPQTRRSPFISVGADGKPLVVDTAEVPENSFWVRRIIGGDVERVDDAPAKVSAAPTGREPVVPLTTREGK